MVRALFLTVLQGEDHHVVRRRTDSLGVVGLDMHGVLRELLQVVNGVHQDHVLFIHRLRRLGDVEELRGTLRFAVANVVTKNVTIPDASGGGLGEQT